jgi:hypothetical protein
MIKKKLAFLLVVFLSLEFFSYLLVSNNLLIVNETPKLYQDKIRSNSNVSTNWWTEKELWGAWHKKNVTAHHNLACFTAEYKSNSIGARDDEFVKSNPKTTYLLLGDSFAEGYGVNFEETAHKKIENATGYQLLNFGASGNGPLQYWLIYDNLAKEYSHDGLIIFFLPANDFTDNDYDYWKKNGMNYSKDGHEKYRPYYKRHENNYDYFIPTNAKKMDPLLDEIPAFTMKQFIVDTFWFVNVWRHAKLIAISKSLDNTQVTYSGYFDATPEQQQAVVYFINKILTTTKASNVIIVSIPTKEDYIRLSQGKKRESVPWWSSFKNFEKLQNKSVFFLDLIDYKPKNIDELFLTCDGHWNANGNTWAADIISRHLTTKK